MKRKIWTGLVLVLVLLVGMCTNAFAAEADPPAPTASAAPTPEPATQSSETEPPEPAPASIVMEIDNSRTYSGMDRPYSAGYVPTAADGVVNLVLPLTTAESLQNNQISVSFNLGDTESSPFQYGNYDQTIRRAAHKTDKGDHEAYVVNTLLPLSSGRNMGNYPVVLTVTGRLADGTEFTQDFTVYVVISDGKDPNATPSPDPVDTGGGGGGGEAAPVPEPKIMLTRYTVSPSPVVAGEPFAIMVTIKNTDEKQALSNVKISVRGETNALLPSGGTTGSFFYDKIDAGAEIHVVADMEAAQNIKAEPHKLTFSIVFDGAKAQKYEAMEDVTIPVMQPIRLEYDEPSVPAELNAGDTVPVSMNIMNLGLGVVHNVRMTLEATGLVPDKTTFLGNIESGASKKGDMYVFVGTRDMDESGNFDESDKYGPISGAIHLVYEDEFGEEHKEEFKFDSYINPPVISLDTGAEEEEEDNTKQQSQWWVSIIIAAAIIVAVILLRNYIAKKQRLQRERDEAD